MFTLTVDSSYYWKDLNSIFYFKFIFSILLSFGSDILIKLIEKLFVMFPVLFQEWYIFLSFFLAFR